MSDQYVIGVISLQSDKRGNYTKKFLEIASLICPNRKEWQFSDRKTYHFNEYWDWLVMDNIKVYPSMFEARDVLYKFSLPYLKKGISTCGLYPDHGVYNFNGYCMEKLNLKYISMAEENKLRKELWYEYKEKHLETFIQNEAYLIHNETQYITVDYKSLEIVKVDDSIFDK